MIDRIRIAWQTKPFVIIVVLAALFRLLAAIFSKGYSMSDDHFLVIHIAQRWLDGFTDGFNQETPIGHSIVYPGLHYLLFYLLKQFAIMDPQIKMFIVRLLHAFYSMLIVIYGYHITLRLSDSKTARQVGIILALFWILPFMSVRNLIEVVCIPPLLIGYYLIIRGEQDNKDRYFLYAGLAFGVSFIFRYQSLIIPGGVGIVLLIQREWKRFFSLTSGTLSSIFLIQGIVDWLAWGYPFAAIYHYITYNIAHRFEYVVGPWYQYLVLILGVFIPPISFYLVYGCLKSWKKLAILFWPVLLFLLFHTYFPNKQERFILPILPFIVILGIIGWNQYITSSSLWKRGRLLLRASWFWFWFINIILLFLLTFTYPKKTRVEPLTYLSHKDDIHGILIEYNKENMPWFPRFYLTKKIPIYRFTVEKTPEEFKTEVLAPEKEFPNYVFLYGNDDLEKRVQKIEKLFAIELQFDSEIKPSLIDDLLYRLNPKHNLNLTSHIYKIVKN